MDEYGMFLNRWKRALMIEGWCIAIAVVGAVLLFGAGFFAKSSLWGAGAGLWLACWFAGTQVWKLWYITRKRKG